MTLPTRPSLDSIALMRQWLLLLVLAVIAGQVLRLIGMPAADFLGSMLVAIGLGVRGARIRVPALAFKLGQGCIGLLVAHSLNTETLASIAHDWPVMLLATAITVLISLLVALFLVRYGDLPGSDAAWGLSPGAASAMVALAEDHGADSRVVATMQYVRVVCVVLIGAVVSHALGSEVTSPQIPTGTAPLGFTVPANGILTILVLTGSVLIGARFPAGALLVPLLAGSAMQLGGVFIIDLPQWLLCLAYGALGCYVGLRFDRETFDFVVRRLPSMLLSALALIALCALSALFIANLLSKDFLSVYLATSPGGLDSMAIIALDTQADVGLVLAMQTMRLFGVVLIGPYLARQIIRLSR
ncbi:AbrB family transcriptional regulator [Pseudomonas sp. LFM046]|uniref:AbrB family transcriptional regulator n=1 Tax=Pseudomonas sp. LFM046 TaxID=1608357 RepID=UPI0005CFE8C3|nr:AbrB family transcriptional regulator [Pseudomonas sp. LFM046]